MKKLIGTFRTEEEMVLAIKHLKEKGIDTNEISVLTREPYEYEPKEGSIYTSDQEEVIAGNFFHGIGANDFVHSLEHYGITEKNAAVYCDRLEDGNFLVFIGVHEEVKKHLENPGTYRAPNFLIHDIRTPGTYTITERFKEDPDNPGTYVALDYGFRKTTPGTYKDPYMNEDIMTPGSITEDDVINPSYHMGKTEDDVEDDSKK